MAADALARVEKAAATMRGWNRAIARARRELHEAIIEAGEGGVPPVVIAKVAGLSRQRVSQILERE